MSSTWLFYTSYIALWVLVAFHTLVLLELVPRIETIRARGAEGDPLPMEDGSDLLVTGDAAPTIQAPELPTMRIVNSRSWLGEPSLLVFVSPSCTGCVEIADELRATRGQSSRRLVAVCRGEPSQCAQFAETYLPGIQVLIDETGEIAKQFRVHRTPTAVSLDDKLRVLRYGFPRSVTRLGLADWIGAGAGESSGTSDGRLLAPLDSIHSD